MKIIGVTGGSGSGKSSFCKFFAEAGAAVINADEISHRVMKRGGAAFDETVKAFGEKILRGGEIDRKALGEIVFSDSEKLTLLNKITHRHIFEEMRREIEHTDSEIILLDVPLLFADDFPIEYDLSIAVTAAIETRLERITARDGISRETALARISAQSDDVKLRRRADISIDNSAGLDALRETAVRLYNIIK